MEQYRELPRSEVRRRVRRLAGRVHEPVPRPAGQQPQPQLGRRAPHRRPRGRRPGRRGRVPEHGAAVLPHRRARRAAAERRPISSCAGPACARTTAGSPTGARAHPTGAPASRRCSSTTSTPRSPRCAGRTTHGLRGGVLIPGVPDDTDILPYYRTEYDPSLGGVRGARIVAGEQPLGQRPPRLRRRARRPRCGSSRPRGSRTAPFWQVMMSGVFERFPNLKFVMTESGCAWLVDMLRMLDGFHMQMAVGRIGELKFDARQPPAAARRASTSSRTAASA